MSESYEAGRRRVAENVSIPGVRVVDSSMGPEGDINTGSSGIWSPPGLGGFSKPKGSVLGSNTTGVNGSPFGDEYGDEASGAGNNLNEIVGVGEYGTIDRVSANIARVEIFGVGKAGSHFDLSRERIELIGSGILKVPRGGKNVGILENLEHIPERLVIAHTRGDGACCANAIKHDANGGDGKEFLRDIGFGGDVHEARDEGILMASCALEGKPVVLFRTNEDGLEILVNGNEGISGKEFKDNVQYYHYNTGHFSRVYQEGRSIGNTRPLFYDGRIRAVARSGIEGYRLPGKLASMVKEAVTAYGVKNSDKLTILREMKGVLTDEVVLRVRDTVDEGG
jgi:hypothetical protein